MKMKKPTNLIKRVNRQTVKIMVVFALLLLLPYAFHKLYVPPTYHAAYERAKKYNDKQYLSRQELYDRLTVESDRYHYSADAANYAIDRLHLNFKANALRRAKQYPFDGTSESLTNIQWRLSYNINGDQFTNDEINYAIAHLDTKDAKVEELTAPNK